MTTPRIVGHRGAPAHAAENTLASFERALADGADLLECDVHLLADGHVAIMHDETIDRTADADSPLASGALADLTREDLARVRVGGGHRVPLLPELLEASPVGLFLEIKTPQAAAAVAELLRTSPHPSAAATTVISFHAEALRTVRDELPDLPISYLVSRLDESAIAQARELRADGVGPWIRALTLWGAEQVHEAGMSLNPWTVNTEQELAIARTCEADTITSDDPAWVRRSEG